MIDRDSTLSTLVEQLLLPLAQGGALRPVPPIGARRALSLTKQPVFMEGDAAGELRRARLAVARRLYPVDGLDELTSSELLLGCALNDLLQVTNPSLTGAIRQRNAERLLAMVGEVIEAAGPPRTLGEVLGRHATFSRLLELTRVDTHVSFWAGSRSFIGARPPRRMLIWPRLRRVSEHELTLELVDMAKEAGWADEFAKTVGQFLAASPLTDLGSVQRKAPSFSWSASSLALLRNAVGRSLALRAIERGGDLERAAAVLVRATERIEDEDGTLRREVNELIETLRARSSLAARIPRPEVQI